MSSPIHRKDFFEEVGLYLIFALRIKALFMLERNSSYRYSKLCVQLSKLTVIVFCWPVYCVWVHYCISLLLTKLTLVSHSKKIHFSWICIIIWALRSGLELEGLEGPDVLPPGFILNTIIPSPWLLRRIWGILFPEICNGAPIPPP